LNIKQKERKKTQRNLPQAGATDDDRESLLLKDEKKKCRFSLS